MRRIFFSLCFLCSLASAQIGGTAMVGGSSLVVPATTPTPTISSLVSNASATAISATFTTAGQAIPSMACGTSAGTYTEQSVDAGVGTGVAHQQMVAGLVPSTLYYCQAAASEPTSATFGAIVASSGVSGSGYVEVINPVLSTGNLTSFQMQYYAAPVANQTLTIVIVSGTAPNFTIASSFVVTVAANTNVQTFVAGVDYTPVSVTAGERIGFWSATYAGPGQTTTAGAGSYYLAASSSLPSGSATYTSSVYSAAIAATVTSVTVQTTQTFTATTTAAPATTPITSLTLGSATTYNSINANNQGTGDTFYNCKSNDGSVYMTSDDNTGFTISGVPSGVHTPMSLMKVLSESPLTIQTINPLTNYGTEGVYGPDGRSSKDGGMFCMGGYLFMSIDRQGNPIAPSNGSYSQVDGQVIWSADHGATWNNFTNLNVFGAQGNPTSPLATAMFGSTPTTFAAPEFVHYCADDGTLGYTLPCNMHDNGEAFVYLVANEGVWNGGGSNGGGNALYLARVARAHLQDLNVSEYQWFTGAVSGDGSLDANWSNSQSAAVSILSNPGELGTPNIQYIPARNRYLMLTFYYPTGVAGTGSNKLNSEWLGYEAPHPWGPWTQIYSQSFSGAYNPIIITDTAFTGLTPTIAWTGDFQNLSNYIMYNATLTIN